MTESRLEIIDYLERFGRLIERGRTILDAGCGDGVPVDQYLVRQGFAVNGIDASARMIERARRNVPEGFYEVKDMVQLNEGEYCVDGVVSLRAMLHVPRGLPRAPQELRLPYAERWSAPADDEIGRLEATWGRNSRRIGVLASCRCGRQHTIGRGCRISHRTE